MKNQNKNFLTISKKFKIQGKSLTKDAYVEYLESCEKNKISDFFSKKENIVRISKSNYFSIYRCARWIKEGSLVKPEWYDSLEYYQKITSLFQQNLKVYVSTFDTKGEENERHMYLLRNMFGYTIVGSTYKNAVLKTYSFLTELYENDFIFQKKFNCVKEKEREKFRNKETFLMYFAELITAIQISSQDGCGLFIHDTQRICIVIYLEQIGVIPKIPYLPILRKTVC